jgi:hypothetical protein
MSEEEVENFRPTQRDHNVASERRRHTVNLLVHCKVLGKRAGQGARRSPSRLPRIMLF